MENETGFSFVKTLVIIGMFSIVAFILNVVFDPLDKLAAEKDAIRKADLGELQTALAKYYEDFGRYPAHSEEEPAYRIVRSDKTIADWGKLWAPYISVIPSDPNESKQYVYISRSNGQQYYLYATLDRGGKDLAACKASLSDCAREPQSGACQCSQVPIGVSCGRARQICNYGVTSGNTSP